MSQLPRLKDEVHGRPEALFPAQLQEVDHPEYRDQNEKTYEDTGYRQC
jgi:hypothetical protein